MNTILEKRWKSTPTRSASPRFSFRRANRCRSAFKSKQSRGLGRDRRRSPDQSRDFGRRISLLDGGERFFEPGLFYAKDAFEGLDIIDRLRSEGPARRARPSSDRTEAFAQRDRVRTAAVRAVGAAPSISAVKSSTCRHSGAAVLGTADTRCHRRRGALAELRSQESLPFVVGRQKG